MLAMRKKTAPTTEQAAAPNKERIVSSAKSLFAAKGFAATGLREIAANAGVSLGNIYNHFQSKEEIFQSVFDSKQIEESLADTFVLIADDFPLNIDKVILSIKRTVDANYELYRIVYIDLIEFGAVNTNRLLENLLSFGQSIFREMLYDKARRGILKELDYDFFARQFLIAQISFFSSLRVLPAIRMDRYTDEEISKMMANVILNGIRREPNAS